MYVLENSADQGEEPLLSSGLKPLDLPVPSPTFRMDENGQQKFLVNDKSK